MGLDTLEVEKLIVATHSSVAALSATTRAIDDKVTTVIKRIDKIDSSMAEVKAEQYRQNGAISMFKWILGTLLGISAIAMSVVGLVATR